MNEELAAQEYIRSRLDSDPTLSGMVQGVWLRSRPTSAPYPAIKIDRLDADDVMVVGLSRVWNNMAFLVRGIVHWSGGGHPDWTDVTSIADRIDEMLHDHEGADSVVAVHSFREETYTDETIEGTENRLYLHAGGIYRVRARAA